MISGSKTPIDLGGEVVSVHADDPSVFPSRLEILQEIGPVGRVHSLKRKEKLSSVRIAGDMD
jgi:hypothetical protein